MGDACCRCGPRSSSSSSSTPIERFDGCGGNPQKSGMPSFWELVVPAIHPDDPSDPDAWCVSNWSGVFVLAHNSLTWSQVSGSPQRCGTACSWQSILEGGPTAIDPITGRTMYTSMRRTSPLNSCTDDSVDPVTGLPSGCGLQMWGVHTAPFSTLWQLFAGYSTSGTTNIVNYQATIPMPFNSPDSITFTRSFGTNQGLFPTTLTIEAIGYP